MRKNISMYKPSLYNVLVPLKGGSTLAYNGVSGALAVWEETDRRIYDLVEGGADNGKALAVAGNNRYLCTVLENLEKGLFVMNENSDERKLVDRIVNLARYDGSWASFTIAPTLACNFGCDYCYQNDEARLGAMNEETKRGIIRFVKKRTEGRRGCTVAWYGGEPLLAPDRVISMSNELAEHCREKKIAYNSQIVTNGYFLTREMTERLLAAKVTNAQVTLDGDRATHDTRRILKNGGATFDRILRNVAESVSVEDFSITVRVNVDKRNKDGVDGLLAHLREAGLSGRKNFRVYFAPVDICSQECLRVVDKVMGLDEYAAVEAGFIERAVEMGLACASLPIQLFSLCAAVKPNGFVLLPNGDVHKCWNTVSYPSERICGLDDADSIEDMPLYKTWTSDALFASRQCDQCGILPNCTGGCAHKSRNSLTTSCVSLKYNIADRLALYAISKNAITWDDLVERGDRLAVNE
ncbi:MAG: radical SAM protein [Synergistaceae bacterium]|nr:radical SAM protein [Synergistaceae bacterium]